MSRIRLILTANPLQLIGASLWPAFLWAAVASGLFFSTFDPTLLGDIATFNFALSRPAGYTIGFFGFWLLGITCSLSTQFLLGQIQLSTTNRSTKEASH